MVDGETDNTFIRYVSSSCWFKFGFNVECVDIFEVAVLIGAMFLVNYVTADSKTNWLEGWAMVSFYLMIVGIRQRTFFSH